MPESASTEFITKTEAALVYRRSERSISRDITNALRLRDRRVLQHIELLLENGTRRPGSEVTIEEVVELRDRGMNPTWLLATAWLKKAYGRRDEPPPAESDQNRNLTSDPTSVAKSTLPEDLTQRAAVLEAQNDALRQSNSDLRAQAERLEKELDRRAQERTEENELQKQNNVLMQQVYNMLSTMQESAGQVNILPLPRTPQSHSEASSTADADIVTDREGIENESIKSAGRSKSSRKQASAKTRRSRRKQQSPQTEPEPNLPADDLLHRWFPTFLGSRHRRK
jgi:hypothetical protein